MKKKELIIILIPTLIFVLFWIGFSIYDSAITSTISQQEFTQINPINPTFNTKAISDLKNRQRFDPIYQITETATPTPTPTPKKPTANNTSVTQATSEGTLTK